MLKIFRVPPTSDLLLHAGPLSEYDLNQIITYKTDTLRSRKQVKPVAARGETGGSTSSEVAPKPLDEEDCCPICQEAMTKEEKLTFCQKGCGNHIHVQCMEVWGKNCAETNAARGGAAAAKPIECPLCRVSWGCVTLDELRVQLGLLKAPAASKLGFSRRTAAPILCTACQQPIVATRYRCIVCPVFDSCGVCFRRQKHPASHPMVARLDGAADWRPAPYAHRVCSLLSSPASLAFVCFSISYMSLSLALGVVPSLHFCFSHPIAGMPPRKVWPNGIYNWCENCSTAS